MAGFDAASAMPRAAEMPTRRPVKLPGPVVTAMRSSVGERDLGLAHDALDQRHQRLGVAAQHRQRFARHGAVLGVEHGGGAGLKRGIDGKHTHGEDYSRPIRVMAGLVPAISILGARPCHATRDRRAQARR